MDKFIEDAKREFEAILFAEHPRQSLDITLWQFIEQKLKDARIDELRQLQKFLAKDVSNIIHPSTIWSRIKKLEEGK